MKIKQLNILFTLLFVLFFTACRHQNSEISNTAYSGKIERRYITPVRVVTQTAQVKDIKYLLKPGKNQSHTVNKNFCLLKNDNNERAFFMLDFGQELHGAVSIITGMSQPKTPIRVRIRLGESVSEAMSELGKEDNATNDHAIRDWVQVLPWCGKIELGNSGFRFVSLELLDDDAELKLLEFSAVAIERDIEYAGSFTCNDERLNDIWMTGARTVHLNMQEYLWDGPKRDRLVWVGDMHPEVRTILSVFGANEVVPTSLDFIKEITPPSQWMNNISSYSMWWIIIQYEWYMGGGDLAYLEQNKDYLFKLLDRLSTFIDENGKEKLNGVRFLDWPTKADPVAVHAGLQSLMTMTFDVAIKLATVLNAETKGSEYQAVYNKLRTYQPPMPSRKSPAALMALSGLADPEAVSQDILLSDGVRDLSTFYGFYVLNALATSKDYQAGIDFISEYWGAMLDLGATTFWEDFDISWGDNAGRIDEIVPDDKVDIHRSYGGYCYEGLRHSLCHGWASGPTAWLSEYVLGVQVLEPGCKVLKVEPHLGDLEWVKGSYPTPQGIVSIEHRKKTNGEIETKVDAPKGVKVLL